MNKKYILLFIGVVVFFVLFIVFIVLQQKQSNVTITPSTALNSRQINQPDKNRPTETETFAPLSNSPQEAAKQFYTYYFSTLANPLANGAYKTNPYLSQDFKDLLDGGYDNGNAPVFCPQNKRTNITVGKEVQVYVENQYMTEETISEAPPGTKDLYTILLKNDNGKWFVEDVNCVY
jgi:hypothetical protein